jgi:hypothetical protein
MANRQRKLARTPDCDNDDSARPILVRVLCSWLGCTTMTDEPWPYNLPIFRRFYRAQSPDKQRTAQVDPATERGMSNPTSGTLCVTGGPHIEGCSPSFIWSDDSCYLAVPQFHGFLGRQRILILAFELKRIFASDQRDGYFQPESFSQGQLVVRINPISKSSRLTIFKIPSDLSTQFSVLSRAWPLHE